MNVLDGVTNTVASAETINAVITLLQGIATAILGMVGSIVDTVMAQPLLLIPIGVVMLRTVISVFKSLF